MAICLDFVTCRYLNIINVATGGLCFVKWCAWTSGWWTVFQVMPSNISSIINGHIYLDHDDSTPIAQCCHNCLHVSHASRMHVLITNKHVKNVPWIKMPLVKKNAHTTLSEVFVKMWCQATTVPMCYHSNVSMCITWEKHTKSTFCTIITITTSTNTAQNYSISPDLW